MTLTKGQQRACRLGDVALASLLPPRVRVPECQAEWLPITPWSVCTLPDWMEWRRALAAMCCPSPGSPFSSALDVAGPDPPG